MKADALHFTSKILGALLSLSMAQAADAVHWNDLPKKIGHGKMRSDDREDRQYRVVTRDGLSHAGNSLIFSPTDVKLTPGGPSIPRDQVAEIRIHRAGPLWDAFLAPSSAVLDRTCRGAGSFCFPGPTVLPLITVALCADAAFAPITVPIEGIKRLLPDRVIKVAP
jgi:hypothetical protein